MVWIISCKKTMVYTIYPIHIPSYTEPDYLIIQYHPCIFVSLHYPPRPSGHITVLFYKTNPTASPIRIDPRYLGLDLHRHRWNHAFATSRWTASQVGWLLQVLWCGRVYSACVLRSWGFVTSIWYTTHINITSECSHWAKGIFDMDSFLKWMVLLMACKIMIDYLVGFQPSSDICKHHEIVRTRAMTHLLQWSMSWHRW